MPRPGVIDPYGPGLAVDEVPDPASPGHLDLPAIQTAALHHTSRKIVIHSMVARGVHRRGWVLPHGDPGRESVAWRLLAQLLPAFGAVRVQETDVPVSWSRRRRYPITSLRAHSGTSGGGTGPPSNSSICLVRMAYSSGSAYTSAVDRQAATTPSTAALLSRSAAAVSVSSH